MADPVYHYDDTEPRRIKRFFAEFLIHGKGTHAGKPFILLPWQEEVINDLFGQYREDNLRRYRNGLILIPRKNGKALHINTPIPTPNGFMLMKDLQVNDTVYSGDGSVTRVVANTDVMHRQSYQLKFSDGSDIIACEDHLWEIGCQNTGRGHSRWKNGESATKHVVDTKWIRDNIHKGGTCGGTASKNIYITIDHCIDGNDIELPIDPYVLGVWLGDGSSANGRLTSNDKQICDEIEKTGWVVHKRNQKYGWTIGYGQNSTIDGVRRNRFTYLLKKNNLIGNKHIPEIYFRASARQRLALVQGLLDTDGYCSKKSQIEFVNKRKHITDGLYILLRSLGIRAISPKDIQCSCIYKGERKVGTYRSIRFIVDNTIRLFRLDRKYNRQRKVSELQFRKKNKIYINEVVDVGIQPVKCIQVENENHTYLAGKQHIKTHNSTLCAGLCLYSLLFGEQGGEIYAVANSRDQARIIFQTAVDFVASSKPLTKRVKVYKNSLYDERSRSIFKVLSRDANTALGLNASMVIFDELLAAPDDTLYNSMVTSLGARIQPLMLSISTAGFSKASFLYQLVEHGQRINEGVIKDDSFYAKLYGIADTDDWTSEEVWNKCNPSLGHTISIEFFRGEYNRAKEFPRFENAFKTLYLNAWLDHEKSWIPDSSWMSCADKDLNIADFKGDTCHAGLDLSSTTDLTALSLCFYRDGKYFIFNYSFCPEEGIKLRSRKDKVPYEMWEMAGYLISTPGNCTDYDYILKKLKELSNDYNITSVSIDRWNSSYLSTKLMEEGFNVISFGQGFASMASPVRAMERLVLGENLVHDGNGLLRWAMSNVILKVDAAGNCKADKAKSRERIDPVIAALMAIEQCSVSNHSEGVGNIVWV